MARATSWISAACGLSILCCTLLVFTLPVPQSEDTLLIDALYVFPAFCGVVATVVSLWQWRRTHAGVLAGHVLSLLLPIVTVGVAVTPWATGWEVFALPLAFAVGQLAVLAGLVVGGRR